MPRRRAGLFRPAFVCFICPFLGWLVGNASQSYSPPPGTSADGVQLVASCSSKHRPGGHRRRASWPNALHARSCVYTVSEQKARGGATIAQRREGIGGNILLHLTPQTSLGSALHTRNFFQKCQLLGNDYKCVYLHRCRFLASNNVANAASTNFNFYRSWQIVVKFYNVKDSILLITRYI